MDYGDLFQQFVRENWGRILAALLATFLLYLIRKFRALLRKRGKLVTGWFAQYFKSAMVKLCALAGIVREEDIESLRRRLEEVSAAGVRTHDELAELLGEVQGLRAQSLQDVGNEKSKWTQPSVIERMGLRFSLTDSIATYLGVHDPIRVPFHVMDTFVHGPFCVKCDHTLVIERHGDGFATEPRRLIVNPCPHCNHRWSKNHIEVPLGDAKREIYQALDAEFRRTKGIRPSDQNAIQ